MSEIRLWGWKRITLLIILVLLSFFILSAGISYYFLNHVDAAKARLIVEEGNVTVNGKVVTGIMGLKQGDFVQTSEEGLATVMVYDSVIVNLEQNTKIRLKHLNKNHPLVEQFTGSTWNKFTGMFGVKDYTLNYETLFASAQGTTFEMAGRENKIQLFVADGQVELETSGQNYTVTENNVVEKKGEQVLQRDASSYENKRYEWQRENEIETLEALRLYEIEQHWILLKIIKQKYKVTDEKITEALKEVDAGNYKVDELVKRVPIPLHSVAKWAELTKKIQQLKKEKIDVEKIQSEVVVKKDVQEVIPEANKFVVSNESIAMRNKFVMTKPEMVRIDKE